MAKSVLEDEILESLGKIDEFQAAIKVCQDKVAKGKEELSKTQQGVKQQEGSLQADVDRLEEELKSKEAILPVEFRADYNRIVKSRGSDAMAQVDGESCGGCFQRITANTHNALVMGRAVFCQSCGRLLYLPEDRSPGRGRS
jgi:predicted  nucleic acid-binding Zn-ribbon protein